MENQNNNGNSEFLGAASSGFFIGFFAYACKGILEDGIDFLEELTDDSDDDEDDKK